jgi:hypothetical protein
MITLKKYQYTEKDAWDNFVKNSRANTFLLLRDFVEYHSDRFQDFSLMIYRKGKLEAVLPGNIKDSIFYSHQGLTYGGLITSSKLTATDVLAIFSELEIFLRENGISEVYYKVLPYIYHKQPMQEDIYALYRLKAKRVSCTLSSTIFKEDKVPFNESRKSGLRKAKNSGVKVQVCDEFESFWDILNENLLNNHGAKPVHTVDEIRKLHALFPENIVLVSSRVNDRMVAGTVLFVMGDLIHVQYISANTEGKQIGAIDLLFDEIINSLFPNIATIDFGHSNEDSGNYLNERLIFQKEGFGGRGVVYETFHYKLPSPLPSKTDVEEKSTDSELRNVGAEEYEKFFPTDPNPFVSDQFISLNAHKVDRIVRLVQDADKVQLGLIAGIKDNVLLAPFSAPFGGFHHKGKSIYTSVIESFVSDLQSFAIHSGIKEIRITLPPDMYCNRTNAKLTNVLMRKGFQTGIPDITNHIDLKRFKNVFTHNSSRTYYNQAFNKGLSFAETNIESDKKAIYDLIVENRIRYDRPIHMSFEDVLNTANLFPTDFFKIVNADQEIIAGAMMYRFHKDIVYALLWGDDLKGRSDRAMDFLVFNLWSHYKAAGFHYIDLGISTVEGIPNEGLLRFKETHECQSSLRFHFKWKPE